METELIATRPVVNARDFHSKGESAQTLRQEVVILSRFGGPEGFELVETVPPVAGVGEVRVRVLAASVQFTDVILRKGKYPGLSEKPPIVLGYDVVGEINQVGPGVAGFEVGERVADLTVTGSYARYRTLRADRVTRVPIDVDPAEADALILSWLTAYQLLHRVARVRRGQAVLIRGAAGAVGQALVSLGRLAGLRMWGTARASHAELVRSLGATPIDYRNEDVHAIMPEGFDVVFDGIGEQAFAPSWRLVRKGGMLCSFGFSSAVRRGASMSGVGWSLLRVQLWNVLSLTKAAHFYSVTAFRRKHPDLYRTDLGRLFQLLSDGAIKPRVADRIGLEGVPDAHRRIEAGGLDGKIIICPE